MMQLQNEGADDDQAKKGLMSGRQAKIFLQEKLMTSFIIKQKFNYF
jgi:hypothetical protein